MLLNDEMCWLSLFPKALIPQMSSFARIPNIFSLLSWYDLIIYIWEAEWINRCSSTYTPTPEDRMYWMYFNGDHYKQTGPLLNRK